MPKSESDLTWVVSQGWTVSLGAGFHCVTLLSDLFQLFGIRSQSWLWVAWPRDLMRFASYYHHILIFGCCLSHFHHFRICLFFPISSGPNKRQICNLESKSVFFPLSTLFFSSSSCSPPICVMYSPREREQRRIVDQRCEKLSHGLGVLEREVHKCRRLFYDL